MRYRMTLARFGIAAMTLLVLGLAAALPARAQYSDLDLGMDHARRDSLLAAYDNVFPILGRKALEHGVRLPKPLGVNLNYFVASQKIAITNLALAVNGGEWVDMSDVITFEDAISDVENVNMRVDLWVLPFFNVYGLYGQSWATTRVNVSSPLTFSAEAEPQGQTYGPGFTAAGGLQGFWFAFDMNWTWSDLDILADPVGTRTLGLRVGKNYRWQDKSVAAWVGAMKVDIDSGTQGTVKLSDVLPDIPPEYGERFQEWYDGLTPPQQGLVDAIRENWGGDLRDAEISYSLDKTPTAPWTMAVGGQIEFSRTWQFRSEFNFLGDRTSILANLVYRIDI